MSCIEASSDTFRQVAPTVDIPSRSLLPIATNRRCRESFRSERISPRPANFFALRSAGMRFDRNAIEGLRLMAFLAGPSLLLNPSQRDKDGDYTMIRVILVGRLAGWIKRASWCRGRGLRRPCIHTVGTGRWLVGAIVFSPFGIKSNNSFFFFFGRNARGSTVGRCCWCPRDESRARRNCRLFSHRYFPRVRLAWRRRRPAASRLSPSRRQITP